MHDSLQERLREVELLEFEPELRSERQHDLECAHLSDRGKQLGEVVQLFHFVAQHDEPCFVFQYFAVRPALAFENQFDVEWTLAMRQLDKFPCAIVSESGILGENGVEPFLFEL